MGWPELHTAIIKAIVQKHARHRLWLGLSKAAEQALLEEGELSADDLS